MQSDYAETYRDLYNHHWWWRAREEFIVQQIDKRHSRRDGHVLDIGCGDGLFFPRLEQYGTVEGVEADESIVSESGPFSNRIYRGFFDAKFEPQKACSLIVALDVLEHLPDPVGALRHAVNLLEPGGIVLLTVPAFDLLWTNHDDLNHHFTRYTKTTFRTLANVAGMRIDDCRYFYHWLFPLKLGVRAKEFVGQAAAENPKVPGAAFNWFGFHWSRFEQRFLTPLQLPFGSSLLVIGGRAAESRALRRSADSSCLSPQPCAAGIAGERAG